MKQKVFVSMKNHDTVDMTELWRKGGVLAQVRTAALLAGGRRSGRCGGVELLHYDTK